MAGLHFGDLVDTFAGQLRPCAQPADITRLSISQNRTLLPALASPTLFPVRSQLPLEAVRDLLGIMRAVYALWQAEGRGDLAELELAGKELREALELARRTEPDTVGHRAAWAKAERATERLGRLVGEAEALAPIVRAAGERVRGR